MVEVLLYFLKIHILFKIEMILALIVKQLRVSIEITKNESRNIIFNVLYRPRFYDNCPPLKFPPSPKINPKPNPNPNQGAIFFGGQLSGYQRPPDDDIDVRENFFKDIFFQRQCKKKKYLVSRRF